MSKMIDKQQRPYRGKRIDNGEWVEGWYIRYEHMGVVRHIVATSYAQIYANSHDVDPETVGQYFGFGDSEEAKVFPGDIVKTLHTRHNPNSESGNQFSADGVEEYEKIGLLEYYQGYSFGPRLKWNKGHLMIPNTSTLWRMKAVVIGNRWDHPHLLKG